MSAFTSRRPALADRCFTSAAVDAEIERIGASMADRELAWMFGNALPNTLDTAVHVVEGGPGRAPDTFVVTGDIPAMWLRDSTAQVWPYLRFAPEDARLQRLLAGVIHRQVACLAIDPYANAFEREPGASPWGDDATEMHPLVHERKWELDSPCAVIRLSHAYWQACGDLAPFDAAWCGAMLRVLAVLREQQQGPSGYRFQRRALNPLDSLPFDGAGWPSRPIGLIRSAFRPSDDACTFPLLVPANFMAAAALRQLAALARTLGQSAIADEAASIAAEVQAALDAVPAPWPYEIDGFGNQLFIDDANVPSLLALPYLGACRIDDPRYLQTRRAVLGPANPFFFNGRVGRGIGSPHTGPNRVWPMSLIVQALTSRDDAEILACLAQLKTTHAGTGFLHESFDADDPARFTRPWFAWANSLFGELILQLERERPHVLQVVLP